MADIESGSTSSLHHASPSRVENSTPEELLQAKQTFKEVFDEYKQQVVDNNNLESKSKKVEDMTVEEKQQLSDYRNIQTILTETNDGEKEFEVPGLKFEGEKTSFENVPVEGLTGYLGKRIDELNERVKTLTDPPRALTEEETKELNAAHQELGKKHQQYAILDKFSVKLLDLPSGTEIPKPGTFAYERLAWEAYMISQDPLRASTNSDPAMQMEENWLAASRALDRRRILVDPPAVTPAPVAAAPAAAATAALSPAPVAPAAAVSPAAPPAVTVPGGSAVSSPASVDTSTAGKTYTGRFMSRTEEMDKRARIQAINQVNKELKVDKWWQRLNPIDIFRKARVRWGEDYYTTKYTEIIKAEMIKNNTSLLEYDFATNSVKAINDQDRESERLTGEEKLKFIEGLEAEEKSRRLGQKLVDLDHGDPADKALKTAMFKDLLRPLAMRLGDTGDLAFASREKKEEEMQKLFRKFLGDKLNSTNASDADVKAKLKDFFGADLARNTADSMYFSGSLLDMTEEIVKDKTAAAFADDSLADIINLKFAETTWLHGTEFKYKNTDKLVHWAKSHRLPLTPMVMAATFSIVTGVVVAGSKSSLTKLTVPVVGTIFGAITSAVRAKAEQNKDMTKYRIERALGKVMNPNLKKHKEYERMSYNIKKYEDLLNGAPRNSNVPQTPDLEYEQKSIDQLRKDVEADVKANYTNVAAQTLALRRIGEMQARLELSMKVVDASGKRTNDRSDFLSFNEKTVDQNRAHMLLEYTKLRLETSRIIKAEIVSQMRSINPNVSQADIDLALVNKENEMKTSEDTWRQRYISDLLQNKADKDKEFNVHKVVKSAKAAGFGSVVGLFTGLGIHEGAVWAGRGISGGLEAIEHVIKDAGIGNAAGIDKNIQFLHGINEGLQGQSVVDRWNSIKSTDQFQDVLAKLAGVVPVEHNGRVDSFIGLYNHPGTVDLGTHYSITSNANHELSFWDKTTNTNVAFPFPATVDQNGLMHIIGDKANLGTDLPVDLRTELTQGNFDIQPGPYHRETIFGGPKDPIFDPADPTTASALGSIPATEHAQLFGEDVMIPKNTEFRQDPSGFTDLVIKSPDPKIDGTVIMNDVQVKPDGTITYDSGIDRSAIQVSEVNYVDTTKTITPEQMWNENSTHVDKIEGYNYNLHQVQYDKDLNRNISVGHRVELDARDYKTADGKYVMEPYPTKDVSIQKGLIPEKMDLQKYFDPKYGGEQGAYALVHPAGDGHNEIIAFKPVDGDKLVFDIHNTDPTKKIFVYDNATHDYTKEVSYTDFSKMYVNENELNKFSGASQVGHNYKLLNLLAPNTPTAPAGAPQPFGMLSIGQMVVEDKNGVPVIKGASGGWQYDDGRAVTNPSELQTVWKSTRAGIFNGRPEGVPTGSKLVEINGHRIDELYKTWDIKPPKEIIDQPLIVAPWDIRDPLRRLRAELLMYYPEGAYPRNTRINELLRSSNAPGTQRSYVVAHPIIDSAEGKRSLVKAKEAFERADEINIVMGGAIGDAVLATAYVNAIQNALARSTPPRTVKLNIMVSDEQEKLFDALGLSNPNISIIKIPRSKPFDEIRNEGTRATTATNPLFLQFQHFNKDNPVVESTNSNGKNVTAIWNLLTPGIELYNNENDKEKRYSKYIEDLFSLSPNSIDSTIAQPLIKLPANESNIYNGLVSTYHIDRTKPQIGIVIEGNGIMMGKRYKMDNWAQVISELSASRPDFEFNIVYNPSGAPPGYTQTDIEAALTNAGVSGKSRLVHGSLTDMAVFLKNQTLVLANDTGLGHVAAAVEGGPKVGVIFSPKGLPTPKSWLSSKRQNAILYQGDVNALPDIDASVADENLKLINRIPPAEVARRALDILALP